MEIPKRVDILINLENASVRADFEAQAQQAGDSGPKDPQQ